MSENSNHDSVVSMRTMEIVTALMFIIVGAVVMVGSIKLGAKWGSDGPESGYFPFYLSLIILVCSSVTLIQSIRAKELSEESFVEKEPFRQVMAVLIPAALFVLGVQLIGIYVAGVIYITFFMVWLGKYAVWKALAVGLGVSIVLYMMFEYWFQIPLPHGSLFNPLAIIGLK
ncbi:MULTISPECIES: tripartite tricarboxylate transporter TctB family protein [unclassified Polynucleobacter]|uniref:tripartite tricarboxylate transporter TctB family protein n=1 Tax=unclassified Polynucleobacter TaxID=2640945 RepID=UPI00257327DA|nr:MULTISPECIES: tripartite tricarboxylate transporter TctB family protein [unclassified Polynucleobacter]BEI43184.1 tripartite tricarboxylate transporter TctB family protein [Polynucleobacter sp. HIN10]BEI44961.1 tripartite tricarboxylate transporter TctB family protein [Polynucleobacter sp. HIN11]